MREYFSELLGNENTKNRLGASIESGTLPHAFLISGPKGSGKKTLTLELAAALNCENKGNNTFNLPCHTCNTCRRIKDGNYTDITHLARTGDRATIGVEEVRLFRDAMFLSATESDYKIYVIHEADKLTPNAQNAMLKVLEEPPSNVIILLLAESTDNVLTTIKSRSQSISMTLFDFEALKKHIVSKSEKARSLSINSPDILNGILMSSHGRIGKALSLLSDKEALENAEGRELISTIVNSLRQGAPYSELYSAFSNLPTNKADFISSLELLSSAIRDIMLIKLDRGVELLFYASRETALHISKDFNSKRLAAIHECINEALDDVSRNAGINAISADLSAKIKLL